VSGEHGQSATATASVEIVHTAPTPDFSATPTTVFDTVSEWTLIDLSAKLAARLRSACKCES
jgi:hypothetical protein